MKPQTAIRTPAGKAQDNAGSVFIEKYCKITNKTP